MSAFALVWAMAGSGALPGLRPTIVIGAVVLTLLIVVPTWLTRSKEVARLRRMPAHWWRDFQIAGGSQLPAIALVVIGAIWAGVPPLIPALVSLVVGAHFVPMRCILRDSIYVITAVGLAFVAAAGALVYVSAGAEASILVATLGSAGVLWVTAGAVALRPTRIR